MYPKPERILELLNSIEILVSPTEQKIEEDKQTLEYIKTQKNAFSMADLFEAHLRVGLYSSTLLDYYQFIKTIINDISFRRGIKPDTFNICLLGIHKKFEDLYLNSDNLWRFDTSGVILGALRRLKNSIEEIAFPYILHIPHAGVIIPEEYRNDYLLDESELHENVYQYADYKTDEIFDARFTRIMNIYSRLFMDPERFFDDRQESMQVKHGLGWFYENAILEKKPLRTTQNKEAIASYYHEHHERLEYFVEYKLKDFDTCTIIDCHSFSNTRYWFHDATLELPDICIGYDEFHKDDALVEAIKEVFKDYKVSINTPYAGSMVPTKYYMKDSRVKSVMIEINKKLYLEEDNITFSKQYRDISDKINEIYKLVSAPYK